MTPAQLLTEAADRIAGWPSLPERAVSVAVATAAGLDADAFDDPDADPARIATARQALLVLGRDIAIRTGNRIRPDDEDPEVLRDNLDLWAMLTDAGVIAEQLRAAAQMAQASS